MRTAPRPREDSPLVEIVGTTCFSPPALRTRTAPGPREDSRFSATVVSPPPEPGMLAAPGPRKDGHMIAVVASPPRELGVQSTPGPRVEDTGRDFCVRLPRLRLLRHPPCPGVTPRI